MKRPTVLLMGSYGQPDSVLSSDVIEKVDRTVYELGRALVERDIDLAVGGRFAMAAKFIDGAVAACKRRKLNVRDRVTTYYAEQWPPSERSRVGQLYQIDDNDNFWLRLMQEADAMVAISGRENTRTTIDCAELLRKPVFPLGTIEGAAGDAWKRLSSPNLRFLGDHSLDPKGMAERLAETIQRTVRVQSALPSRSVFLVHGHDEGARESVAAFVRSLDLTPIVLREHANEGRTIIEKFEAKSNDVGFAIVLLTPDDEGRVKSADLKPRARQNVILELGYFVGRLGRKRVCALKKGDIEVPSDYHGVGYIDLDARGAWKRELAKEIDAAGISVDLNKALKG